MTEILFCLFSSIALISGIMVITARNPVHSVLFLILVFCNAAGLLILLNLDFFAMIFLVVYVGAIAVLFLFVVMMLNIKVTEVNENRLRYLPIGGLIGILFLFEILVVIDNDFIPVLSFPEPSGISTIEFIVYKIKGLFINTPDYVKDLALLANLDLSNETRQFWILTNQSDYIEWSSKIQNITNIQALGQVIYTYYFYSFIVASLILLVAMIGAIVLTMHKGVFVKKQDVFEQNSRDFTKTIQKIR
jgi:NADH-ubiquinone oxidoreductase chain 6